MGQLGRARRESQGRGGSGSLFKQVVGGLIVATLTWAFIVPTFSQGTKQNGTKEEAGLDADTTEPTPDDGAEQSNDAERRLTPNTRNEDIIPIEFASLSASSSLPSTRPSSGEPITYDIYNTADRDEETAWIADQGIEWSALGDACGDAQGSMVLELADETYPREWIEWRFEHPVEISHLAIINGYAKSRQLHEGNSRIRTAIVRTDDHVYDFELEDSAEPQELHLAGSQTRPRTLSLRLEILSVYCGTAEFLNSEGDLVQGRSHPAVTRALPYGPLHRVLPPESVDGGLVLAERLPLGERPTPVSWMEVPPYPTRSWTRLNQSDRDPVSAEWRVGWEGSNLHIEVRVTDSQVAQPYLQSPYLLWKGDSIEVEIGPDSRCLPADSPLRTEDRHYLIAPSEVNGSLVNAVNEPNEDGAYFDQGFSVQVPGTAERTNEGYIIRAQIPLLPTLLSEADWHILSANFNVSDVTPAGQHGGMASTNPRRIEAAKDLAIVNTRPYLWGTLVLHPGVWTESLLRELQSPC